jgi:hypothetical protein
MIRLRIAREYIEHFLKIRTKDRQIVPFKLNAPQQRMYNVIREQERAGRPVRIIILKARQMGFSTLTEGLLFWRTATGRNVESLIIAHKDEATANLYRMSRRFYDLLPDEIKPMLRNSNAQELNFDVPTHAPPGTVGLGSRIRCATAGGSGVGRSYTLQCVHMSEYAFWPGDKAETYTGIMQAVPDAPGTMVIVESTANGFDDFKRLWDNAVEAQRAGEEGFVPVFFPWYELAEYRRTVPPGFVRTTEEQELAETFGLDDEQLAWRRWCIRVNCGGDLNQFRQEFPATPDEAFIATGTCVFPQQLIVNRRKVVQGLAMERGQFTYDYDDTRPQGEKIRNIRWEPDPRGVVRLLVRPEDGAPYVVGGDTAGTGSDKFTGQVLDNRTGVQVAVLQHKDDETFYARQMYCLGQFYNQALLGIETNYSTYPQKELERLGYPHLYVRERVDTYTGALMQAFGFETTTSTRPLIVDNLRSVVRENIELIGDYNTLGEMLTFVYDEHYKPQAQEGEHDDLVMALAIAHQIRPQQSYTAEKPEDEAAAEWTDSMWEDWMRASEDERRYLENKWGRPRR